MSRDRLLALALVAAALAAIGAGLVVTGSPEHARLERLDERRLRDLDRLARRIESFRLEEGRLPDDLQILLPGLPTDLGIRDPATGEPYLYQPRPSGDFRLCAMLALPRDSLARRPVTDLPGRNRLLTRTTEPATGQHCLEARRSQG